MRLTTTAGLASGVVAAIVAVMVGSTAVGSTAERTGDAPRRPDLTLEHAASSIDALIGRLLDALGAKDRDALHRLRVTDREYIHVIMAGTVEPGEPLRDWPENVNRYFWNVLNDKSNAYELHLLERHGGRRYRLKSISWDKGTQQYATYTGYKQLRLELETDEGRSEQLETGSVAEVDGQYKFVSFIRD